MDWKQLLGQSGSCDNVDFPLDGFPPLESTNIIRAMINMSDRNTARSNARIYVLYDRGCVHEVLYI